MRPVPVVFLRLAFSPQLTARCQLRTSWFGNRVLLDSAGSRTLPGLSSRVAARSAGVLLDVEGATTWVLLAEFSVHRVLVCRTLPLYLSQGTTGMTYRNACTACASCCDAFRSWRYPLLYGCQSRSSVSAVPSRQVCGVLILNGDYHSDCQYVCTACAEWSGSIPRDAVTLVEVGKGLSSSSRCWCWNFEQWAALGCWANGSCGRSGALSEEGAAPAHRHAPLLTTLTTCREV